jgi:hypothetical protein
MGANRIICAVRRGGFEQLGLRGSVDEELGDHVDRYACTAKYRIAAHDLGIADDQSASAEQ